jgi:hypothetical protein
MKIYKYIYRYNYYLDRWILVNYLTHSQSIKLARINSL